MGKMSGHILIVVFLLASFVVCHSQEASRNLDREIARYEMLCEMCLDLRTRIRQGEDVSRNEAETYINRFLAMNRNLKAREADMSLSQIRWFNSISQWFSTGERPSEVDLSDEDKLPREAALPSVHMAQFPVSLTALRSSDVDWGDVTRLGSTVRPSFQKKGYALLSMSAPDFALGLSGGFMYGRIGGYASVRSNFQFDNEVSYSCLSDGSMPSKGMFWSSGEVRQSNLTVSAGILAGLDRWASLYAGAGYGWRKIAWEDVDGAWAEVSDISHEGLAVDAGLIFTIHRLALSAGVSTISFKTVSFNLGIGICF